MEWVTTTAKTLPEAIDLALDNLGVDESEAEIVVLEEPSKGLFGRTRGAARVEARVKPKAIRPKVERGRGRRSRSDDGSRGGRSRNRKGRGRSGGNGNGRGSDRSGKSKGNARSGGTSKAAAESGSSAVDTEVKTLVDNGRRDGRSGSEDRSSNGSQSSRRRRKPAGDKRDTKQAAETKQEETPVEEVEEHLRSFLGGLTEAFGLEGEVEIDKPESDVMVATVQGQHGLMVGPKGRTLDAIQELARVSSQRAAPSSIRIRVDVGGYREQRSLALGDFARKAADQAVDNGREVSLEPMSPADRKAVHDALVEDDRVETRSVGTEPRRRVIVIPVDGTSDSDDSDDSDGSDEEE